MCFLLLKEKLDYYVYNQYINLKNEYTKILDESFSTSTLLIFYEA